MTRASCRLAPQRCRPDQVAISAGYAEQHGLALGDPVTVDYPDGRTERPTVGAIYAEDRTSEAGQIRLHRDAYLPHTSRPADVNLRIALGIANTLSLSIHERTREPGLLRAVGQTRTMVRGEALTVGLFGTVGGLGLGLFPGWALAGECFGSFAVPELSLAVVLMLGALVGVLAAGFPAHRAAPHGRAVGHRHGVTIGWPHWTRDLPVTGVGWSRSCWPTLSAALAAYGGGHGVPTVPCAQTRRWSRPAMADAVVVGAGHNGLVAANLLADAGWEVEVLEATGEAGGSVRTAELTLPGFRSDVFSAFFPLGIASPVLRRLGLEEHGLEWVHAPLVVAHPHADGRCAVLSRDLAETAASLDAFAPGDGAAWEGLYGRWRRLRGPVLSGLFSLFPPVKAGLALAIRTAPRDLLRLGRFALLPVRRLAEEEFRGAGGGLLLGGNALHADIGPEAPGSGFLGFLLCGIGQELGYPAVKGGAGELPAALVRRLEARGGRVRCHTPVEALEIRNRRAVAVRTADGQVVPVGRAVVGAVDAITLYRKLIGEDHLPPAVVDDLDRFQFDNATVKVDWALDGGVPWEAEPARRAGTVHLTDSMDDLTMYNAQLACGVIPAKPLIVVGQMTTTDPTRSPSGTEALWAYAHVPQMVRGDAGGSLTGAWTAAEAEEFADRMEARIEAKAPGFRERIRARHVMGPPRMQELNPSLVHGALNVGTAQLYQQLIFRPTPAMGRPTTPIRNVYLASGSAHPGGGVHGAPGANAATLALRRDARRRLATRAGG